MIEFKKEEIEVIENALTQYCEDCISTDEKLKKEVERIWDLILEEILPEKIETREKMVERLVDNDIDDIRQGLSAYHPDIEFLTRVLKGEGWKPYNQLTDVEIEQEYKDREFPEE